MMWTLKTGWHVKCVHSGYIRSAYSISHADFHCHCDRTSDKVHVVKNRELRKRQNSLLGHKIKIIS